MVLGLQLGLPHPGKHHLNLLAELDGLETLSVGEAHVDTVYYGLALLLLLSDQLGILGGRLRPFAAGVVKITCLQVDLCPLPVLDKGSIKVGHLSFPMLLGLFRE